MEDFIEAIPANEAPRVIEPTFDPTAAPDFDFNFFHPPTLEACMAVESFLLTGVQRHLVQLLTYNEEQLAQAMEHITAIEKILCLA